MIREVAIIAVLSSGLASACSCSGQTVDQAKTQVHVVFRGKIVRFYESEKFGRIAVFSVDRVWKGTVSKAVEMLAFEEMGTCAGFLGNLLKEDNELLVYGYGSNDMYGTDICTRTALAKDNPDINELGEGSAPK